MRICTSLSLLQKTFLPRTQRSDRTFVFLYVFWRRAGMMSIIPESPYGDFAALDPPLAESD